MKFLLSGSTGLVGSALAAAWEADGHTCLRLVRGTTAPSPRHVPWDPRAPEIADHPELEGLDAAVHLAGRNIACRWTPANRASIRESRVGGTALLARTLAQLDRPPPVLLSASATGYYGDTGDRLVDETSGAGTGFLASVCKDWEAAAAPAADAGIRVVYLRNGVILSPRGGMLAKLLPIFRAGLGGRLGAGDQFLSWLSLPDTIGAIRWLIETESVTGPVNLVSPHPVTNLAFTQILAGALSRPARLPVPAFALRSLMGQMAEETALASSRVRPGVLEEQGYRFAHPELAAGLKAVLGT